MPPNVSPHRTLGFKPVLISNEAFAALKSLQSWRSCQHLPVRFDLKDLATAFVLEAMEVPGLRERVFARALATVTAHLTPPHLSQPKE